MLQFDISRRCVQINEVVIPNRAKFLEQKSEEVNVQKEFFSFDTRAEQAEQWSYDLVT